MLFRSLCNSSIDIDIACSLRWCWWNREPLIARLPRRVPELIDLAAGRLADDCVVTNDSAQPVNLVGCSKHGDPLRSAAAVGKHPQMLRQF
jgi:hypothetical protein